MTCIIAQKSELGVVMVADRRVLNGFEAEDQEKMFVLPNGAVIGAAGGKFMMDDFLPQMEAIEAKDFDSLVFRAEDIVSELYKRYRPRFGDSWPGFGVLVMGLDKLKSGRPRIRLIEDIGVSEEVERFQVVGHGSPYAMPFVKLTYEPNATLLQMWRGSFFAIGMIERLELDESVGGIPDVITLSRDSKPDRLDVSDIRESGQEDILKALDNTWQSLAEWFLKRIAFQTEDMAFVYWRLKGKRFDSWVKKAREEVNDEVDRRALRMKDPKKSGLDEFDAFLADLKEESSQDSGGSSQ